MIGAVGGAVTATHGALVEAALPTLCVGSGVRITTRSGRTIPARVTAIAGQRAMLAPFAAVEGIGVGDSVASDPSALDLTLGTACLGRAIDALGTPIDGGPPTRGRTSRQVVLRAAPPAERRAVSDLFVTGVRAIDGPLAFGAGARIGIFGAPGCGKSTLLETIVAGSNADVSVIALIGERGREAERWLQTIGARTTLICATSDRSAAERLRAAHTAFAQADALRRRGLRVLLVVDSLARIASAARDIALATGEPAGRGGYPSSVFAVLAQLIETAGAFQTGSITLVATVLSDGPDPRDPVGEACRAALDGHVVLSERLAARGWFPAIDLPASASRTLGDVASSRHLEGARTLRGAVSLLDDTRDARGLGLDPGAGDAAVRRAVATEIEIAGFLRQSAPASFDSTLTQLGILTDMLSDGYQR